MIKNLNLFPPIYSWNNYWGSMEERSLKFWFLFPIIMMFDQIVNVKRISAMAWVQELGYLPSAWAQPQTPYSHHPYSSWPCHLCGGNASAEGMCRTAHSLSPA